MLFCPFSGWNPVVLWFHLQKTCEHVPSWESTQQCVARRTVHLTAGQPWRQMHSLLCNKGGQALSAQKKESSFVISPSAGNHWGADKNNMMTAWGGAFCIFASSLCLKGLCNCLPGVVPEGTVLPPQHSQIGICLPLPQLRELLQLNTLGRDLIHFKGSTLLLSHISKRQGQR